MITYRPVRPSDRDEYLQMSAEFYAGNAVDHPIPAAYREATFEELMRSDVYAAAFILEYDGETAGYALIAKTFSQEAGGMTVWIEELFVKQAFRSRGIGRFFLEMYTSLLPESVKRVRLETERDNETAVALYRLLGFEFLAYDQMILDREALYEE